MAILVLRRLEARAGATEPVEVAVAVEPVVLPVSLEEEKEKVSLPLKLDVATQEVM